MAAKLFLLAALGLLSSCGTFAYTPPSQRSSGQNTIVIPAQREAFWKLFVSSLSSEFFVINNLDRETGLVNVSYSGDPEQFVDCGWIKSTVYGKEWEFPAARANAYYEYVNGIYYFRVNWQMQLDGRMNIIVQEEDKTSTRVTVNTRYALNRRIFESDPQGRSASNADTVSFNYGQEGYFAVRSRDGTPLTCRSTGNLERQILSTAQKSAPGSAP